MSGAYSLRLVVVFNLNTTNNRNAFLHSVTVEVRGQFDHLAYP